MSNLILKDNRPGIGAVHINVPLTNISVAHFQRAEHFIASQAFPAIPVTKKSDVFYVIPPDDFNRDEMKGRAPSTESAGAGFVESNDNYNCRRYALHKDLDDSIRDNADSQLQLERQIAIFLSQKTLIQRERRFVMDFMQASRWTFSVDGVNASPTTVSALTATADATDNVLQFNDAGSEPIEVVDKLKEIVLERTGFEPNTIVMGKPVYNVLKNHPDLIGRRDSGQTTGSAMVTMENMAELFEVDRILVSKAIYNPGAEGAAATGRFIVGKHMLLCYRPPAPGLLVPSAGYTFVWTGRRGISSEGTMMTQFRMNELTSDRFEIEAYYDQKVISQNLGVFLEDIVA